MRYCDHLNVVVVHIDVIFVVVVFAAYNRETLSPKGCAFVATILRNFEEKNTNAITMTTFALE